MFKLFARRMGFGRQWGAKPCRRNCFAAVRAHIRKRRRHRADRRLLAAVLYLALAVSIFAFLLWFYILKESGATAASSYHFLMPPLGMLFGWLLLGEHVSPLDLLGIVPVVLGIYLVTRG